MLRFNSGCEELIWEDIFLFRKHAYQITKPITKTSFKLLQKKALPTLRELSLFK